MQSSIHNSSAIWAYKILTTLCSIPALMVKFKEASNNGGWLFNTELLQNNKANLMLSKFILFLITYLIWCPLNTIFIVLPITYFRLPTFT